MMLRYSLEPGCCSHVVTNYIVTLRWFPMHECALVRSHTHKHADGSGSILSPRPLALELKNAT